MRRLSYQVYILVFSVLICFFIPDLFIYNYIDVNFDVCKYYPFQGYKTNSQYYDYYGKYFLILSFVGIISCICYFVRSNEMIIKTVNYVRARNISPQIMSIAAVLMVFALYGAQKFSIDMICDVDSFEESRVMWRFFASVYMMSFFYLIYFIPIWLISLIKSRGMTG